MTDRKLFNHRVRWLRRNFPLSYPVKVLLCSPGKIKKSNPQADLGICEIFGCEPDHERSERRPNCFRILVRDNLTEENTTQVLFHEWAHALRAHIYLYGDLNADDPIRALIEDEIWRKWHG